LLVLLTLIVESLSATLDTLALALRASEKNVHAIAAVSRQSNFYATDAHVGPYARLQEEGIHFPRCMREDVNPTFKGSG